MRCRQHMLWSSVAVMSTLLSGCGGGSNDPFERTEVTGTVNLDGAPLMYGEISFRGDAPKDSVEIPQATLSIRDGKFESNPGARPGTGKNSVLLIAYAGDPPPLAPPGDESGDAPPDPKVIGYFSTSADVVDGTPLSFDVTKKELSKSPPL